jgi:ABC-type transport system involved in multi-copper enzyme maturation permease subunit
MFARIAAFEFRYQLRNPIFWVTYFIFFLLSFGATAIDQIRIGSGGNVHKNAPFAIIQINSIMALFAIFVLVAFVANVIVRDDETGYGPIIRSTRVRKFDYLFGRFTGAFSAAALSFTSVSMGILIGSFMPWIDPETIVYNHLNQPRELVKAQAVTSFFA